MAWMGMLGELARLRKDLRVRRSGLALGAREDG